VAGGCQRTPDLRNPDLTRADLTGAFLEGATMPIGQKYEEWLKNSGEENSGH
jgi:uncharacterized protein YjbI with pentapeptide repeats